MAYYDKRVCKNCGKAFSPEYAGQVACSVACRATRRRELKNCWSERVAPSLISANLEWLNSQYENALCLQRSQAKTIAELRERNAWLESHVVNGGPGSAGMIAELRKRIAELESATVSLGGGIPTSASQGKNICKNCGKEFAAESPEYKFCSATCKYEYVCEPA